MNCWMIELLLCCARKCIYGWYLDLHRVSSTSLYAGRLLHTGYHLLQPNASKPCVSVMN